ncbi:MAG: DUF6627 family protein [Halofilum sp. (in: g-proteobacteria)]|nr:DUF6627 family protein [Halofilum sp. (in: g-proteobacteria)]
MNTRIFGKRIGAALCAFALMCTATLPAQAAMIGTDQVLNEARAEIDRAELVRMLDREDVRAELASLGVDPAMAKERVARMTDAEIAQLQGRLAQMPAGESVGGALLLIFLVFVITDVIGATDIFPFINSVD